MKYIPINSLCHLFVIDETSSFVIGSPPEWIKRATGVPFPRHILLGDSLLVNGCNFAEIEFPLYKNFFFNKLRKTEIVCPEESTPRLAGILAEALLGPDYRLDSPGSVKAAYFGDILAVRKNFDPSGEKLTLDDYATFHTYENDRFAIGDCAIRRVDRDAFHVTWPGGEQAVSLEYRETSLDKRPASPRAIPGALSIFCFDSGDGFTPAKECSSFILNAGGRYILFDPSLSSFDRLVERGCDFRDVAAVFISHVHADHDQGLYRFLMYNKNIIIMTGETVCESLAHKIGLMVGDANFATQCRITPIPLKQRTGVAELGIDVYCDLGFHSIPSAMAKIYFHDAGLRDIVLAYSGDTLYDPVRIRSDSFNAVYREDLLRFYDDATHIIHEGGAGLIHTDPEDLIPFLAPGQEIYWMHTGRTNDDGFSRGHILTRDENIVIR
ncbi:MAG TPA: MBL fold metallo-hydrolase [Spirochaetota bacterium]|nr:MBL fold metallo-hydrolase [Spirochaetota bacterium]HNT11214.1 MBL fold metallo-hydrolase [Spirochaetota bacterium]